MKYLNDISYKDCVGKVCKSLNSGDFKILKYNDARNIPLQAFKTQEDLLGSLSKGYGLVFTWCEWDGEYDCEYPHIKVIDGAKF